MAIEVFEIATRIDLKSNAIKVIEDLAKQFEALDKLTKDVQSSLGRVAEELKRLGEGNAELKGLGRSVGSIAKAFDTVGKSSTEAAAGIEKIADSTRDAVSAGRRLGRIYTENADLARAAAHATAGSGRSAGEAAAVASRRSGGSHGLGFGHGLMEAGIGAEMAGRPLLDHATEAMRQAMDVNQLTTRLSADTRLNQADINRALSAAIAATRSSPGTTVESNMQVLLGLRNITGDINQSIIALPEFSHMLNVLQAVAGRKGLAGAEQQAYAAEKAEEIMGGLISEKVDPRTGEVKRTIDIGMLRGHVDDMLKVAVEENMKVDPKMYLQFSRQGRVAGMLISDEFKYFKLPAIMNVLGGPRTGTALNSLLSVVTTAMTPKTYRAWEAAGLAGPPEFTMEPDSRGRMRKKFKPGKLFEIETLIQDTDQWMRDVEEHQHKIGIKMNPREFILSQVKLGQRATVSGYLADVAKMRPDIEKTQTNLHATDQAKVLESADQAVNRLTAAWKNLMQAIGAPALGDAISFLDKLTGYLHKLEDLARANPDWARRIVEGVEIAGAALVGAGGLTMALWAISGPAKIAKVAIDAVGVSLGGFRAVPPGVAATGPGKTTRGLAVVGGVGGIVALGFELADLAHQADEAVPALRRLDDAVRDWLRSMLSNFWDAIKHWQPSNDLAPGIPGMPGVPGVPQSAGPGSVLSHSAVRLTPPSGDPLHIGLGRPNTGLDSSLLHMLGLGGGDAPSKMSYSGSILSSPDGGRGLTDMGNSIGDRSAQAVKDRLDPNVIGTDIGKVVADQIRSTLGNLQITVDGQQLGRIVDQSRDRQAQRPPTGPSLPDVRLGPLFPAHAL